jgi:hypothetical protein
MYVLEPESDSSEVAYGEVIGDLPSQRLKIGVWLK